MKGYNKSIDEAKESNQEFVSSTKATMEQLVSAKEKGVHLLKELATESEKEIQNSLKRTSQLRGELADTQFNFAQRHESAGSKLAEDVARAAALAAQGQGMMAHARSPEEVQAAEGVLKRAEGYAKAAEAEAKTVGTLGAELKPSRPLKW